MLPHTPDKVQRRCVANGAMARVVIGVFLVLGGPTSPTQSRADSFHPVVMLFDLNLDGIGNCRCADGERRSSHAAWVDAHQLGLMLREVFNHHRQAAIRQGWCGKLGPEIDGPGFRVVRLFSEQLDVLNRLIVIFPPQALWADADLVAEPQRRFFRSVRMPSLDQKIDRRASTATRVTNVPDAPIFDTLGANTEIFL